MKLYKFNMQKYGHDIELAYNCLRNAVDSENPTDQDWENYDRIQNLYMKLLASSDGHYAYVDYKTWDAAMQTSMWAQAHRDACCSCC